MKRLLLILVGMGMLSGVCLAGEQVELKDQKAKESYSLGYQFGETIKAQDVEIDLEVYVAGIRDALAGKATLMKPEEIQATLMAVRQKATEAYQSKFREQSAKNLEEGKAFLAENGKKKGVVTLPSGLQYKVLTEGSGKTPKDSDSVTVNYRGTLIDGTEFDSSYSRGQSATFPLNRVIRGWTEALQLMKEGAKWHLFVPPDLGYAERGVGGKIGPNATLIFEVELLRVNPSSGAQPAK